MRLTVDQKHALTYALQDVPGEKFLFGSRVDDHRKGGDIDILIMTDEIQNAFRVSVEVMTKYTALIDEKIDVVIYPKTHRTPEQDSFLRVIHTVPLGPVLQPISPVS